MAHLLFLTSTPPSVAYGSGTWVGISVLRAAIEALGHEVTLIGRSPECSRETTLSRVAFNIRARSRVRNIRPDALIGFDLDGVFVRTDVRRVAAIKGVLADEARYERGLSRWELALQARLEARNVRRADRVITTSAYSLQRIVGFYGAEPAKISIVPEPINLGAWERSLSEAPAKNGPLRVLCVAHLYPRKSVHTLLRAFARLRGNAVLRVVGIGPEKSRLEHLARNLGIAPRVHFLGLLSFRDLISEYRNASVFALPTAQEGFGIVFLEAMASSLPVVAGRAAAVPEVVREGVTALLVDPADDIALAESLERLLDQPALRKAMGSAGRARVREYDAPVVARQFLAAIGLA
jgi:glycosyltransferase involved in cell wall biosynthesis